MVSLPALQRKTLAVLLMEKTKYGCDGCCSGGSFNYEKTVRLYRKEFIESQGQFKEIRQGKYRRNCLLRDENLGLEAAMWVREHA